MNVTVPLGYAEDGNMRTHNFIDLRIQNHDTLNAQKLADAEREAEKLREQLKEEQEVRSSPHRVSLLPLPLLTNARYHTPPPTSFARPGGLGVG